MFDKSNVLVTGASGLVGTALVKQLINLGANVRGTLHSSPPTVISEKVEYLNCDLTNHKDCQKVVQDMEYVFLLAASTSGAAAISSTPMLHVTPNIIMNTQMLEASYNAGVKKVLWLASTTGYPDTGSRPVLEDEMFQEDPYEKYYFAGWTRRFTEILCNMYSKLPNPLPVVVLRPTNIFGPYDKFDPARSHVLPALIKKVVERQDPIEVWGDGNDVRDFIYIDDMIESIILAMSKINKYDPINIGAGVTYSVKQILDIILRVEGYAAKIIFNSTMPSMIPTRKVNVSKSKNVLGFSAKTPIEEGIRNTIIYYKGL